MNERKDNDRQEADVRQATRRAFLGRTGLGLGSIALGSLLSRDGYARTAPGLGLAGTGDEGGTGLGISHYRPRAKKVLYLFMAGAPSQLDLFDPKPTLDRLDGTDAPEELWKKERFAFIKGVPKLLRSPFQFSQQGRSGAWLSELLPHLGRVVDKVSFVRSLHTDHFNHGPAQIFMNCGHQIVGRPSLGSWLMYGLGTENEDLPGFVVLVSGKIDPGAGSACWSSGFLPTQHQGVEFRTKGDPVPCVSNPDGVTAATRARALSTLTELNRQRRDAVGDPEIDTRISAYELAFRMQTSVPELAELSSEPESVREAYGVELGKPSFANNCLLARRMLERGVRFVQLYHRGWDHHGTDNSDDLEHGLPKMCEQTDRATAALLEDLEQRGLLDETLVVWGGEFGRTPMFEGRKTTHLGRDHHPRAFTMWFAGAGIRPGLTLGATDDLGYHVTEDPVHVHDLHATVLHLLGIDHEKLTYRHQGRDFRLTDVHGEVFEKLLT